MYKLKISQNQNMLHGYIYCVYISRKIVIPSCTRARLKKLFSFLVLPLS